MLPLVRIALFATAVTAAGAAVAAPPVLMPHRAVYDLRLDRSDGAKGISGMRGRLVFEALGTTCEGYTINTRFVTQVEGERRSTISDLRSATWEAGDGSSYRFVTRNYVDDQLTDETDGSARRQDDAVSVELRTPEEAKFELSGGVLFPTQHVRRILAAAEAGEKLVVADVYDGSETGRKIYSTTTAIGDRQPPSGDEGGPGGGVLGALPSWPVTIAYFDETEGEEEATTPTYEFSYDLYENGVSRRIVLDYGDFSLSGDLTAIDFMGSGECPQ